MTRGLKFQIKVVEGLYYLYSENKGADQLYSYREADLRLCFCKCINPVFSQRGSYCVVYYRSMSIESFGEPSSERDTDRQTPTPSSGDEDSIVDPGSVTVSDIVSPSSISRPSKAKKK